MENTADPRIAVQDYHQGFDQNSPETFRKTIGDHLIMINGNFSDQPADWQAHHFLTGLELEDWPAMMLREAGRFENVFEYLHVDIPHKAAIVVTRETGSNRFRTWQDEIVTWYLGLYDADWKIAGIFIKDLSNPS